MTPRRWHTEPIFAGSVWLYSCLWCGAAVASGSATAQHEWWHERRGDYADDLLRTEGVGRSK